MPFTHPLFRLSSLCFCACHRYGQFPFPLKISLLGKISDGVQFYSLQFLSHFLACLHDICFTSWHGPEGSRWKRVKVTHTYMIRSERALSEVLGLLRCRATTACFYRPNGLPPIKPKVSNFITTKSITIFAKTKKLIAPHNNMILSPKHLSYVNEIIITKHQPRSRWRTAGQLPAAEEWLTRHE